jgi:hypothetical protein
VLLALLLPAACGGGEEAAPPPFAAGGAAPAGGGADKGKELEAQVKKKRIQKSGAQPEYIAKPEWDMLSPHFFLFVKGVEEEAHSKSMSWKYKDSFADKLDKFYAPPEEEKKGKLDLAAVKASKEPKKEKEEKTIKSILDGILPPGLEAKKEEGLEMGPGVVETGPPNPLTKYKLTEYGFRIIMTGVSNPEVLVEDPEARTHVVHLNDRVGSEGGQVVDILKNRILVRLPDTDAPIEVTLAPESIPGAYALQ